MLSARDSEEDLLARCAEVARSTSMQILENSAAIAAFCALIEGL